MNNFLDKLKSLLIKLFNLSISHYKVFFTVYFFILLASFLQLKELRQLIDISDLIDADFKTYNALHELEKNYDEKDQVSVILRKKDKFSFQEHCLILDWINSIQVKSYEFTRIYSSYGLKMAKKEGKDLKVHPILIPDCTIENSNSEISNQLQLIANSPSGHLLTNKKLDDIFVSFYLRPLDKKDEDIFGSFNEKSFSKIKKSIENSLKNQIDNLETYWVGGGSYKYFLKQGYKKMNVLNLFIFPIFLLVFYFFGISLYWLVFLIISYMLSLIPVYGIMSLFHVPIDLLTSAIPLMLLMATIQDLIFYIYKLEHYENDYINAFKAKIFPSFMTSLTTAIGFGSLAVSDLGAIRRFGIICAIAAIIEWVVSFLIMPKIILRFRKHIVSDLRFTSFIQRISNFKFPKTIAIIIVCSPFIFLSLSKINLRIEDSPERLFNKDHILYESAQYLNDSRDWLAEISLVFDKKIDQSERHRLLNQIQDNFSFIKHYESFDEVKDYLTKNLEGKHKEAMKKAMNNHSSSARWISPISSKERALIYSDSSDINDISSLKKHVDKVCQKKCHLISVLISYSEFGIRVLKTLVSSFKFSLVLISVFLLLILFQRKINYKLLVLLCSLWGPFVLLSLLLINDIGIYFATSIVLSILIGLSGDVLIHHCGDLESKSIQEASFVSLIIMSMIAMIFLFSDFNGLGKISYLMIAGFFLGWFGDIVLFSSLRKK